MKQIFFLIFIVLLGFSNSADAQLLGAGSDNLVAISDGIGNVIMLRSGVVVGRVVKANKDSNGDLVAGDDRTSLDQQTTTTDDNTLVTTTKYNDGSRLEEHVAEDGSTATVNWSSDGMSKISEIETEFGSEKIVTLIEDLSKDDPKFEKGKISKKVTTTITATSGDGEVTETTTTRFIK